MAPGRKRITEFLILNQFIFPFVGIGFGTFQRTDDGCQRVIEPILSPLLYKSISVIEQDLTLQSKYSYWDISKFL